MSRFSLALYVSVVLLLVSVTVLIVAVVILTRTAPRHEAVFSSTEIASAL